MRLRRSITPHRQLAKIGDGAPRETLAIEALKYRIQKIALLCFILATGRVTRNEY